MTERVGDTPNVHALEDYKKLRADGVPRSEGLISKVAADHGLDSAKRQALSMSVGKWEKRLNSPLNLESAPTKISDEIKELYRKALRTGTMKERLAAAKEIRKEVADEEEEVTNIYGDISDKELAERVVQTGVALTSIEFVEKVIAGLKSSHQLEVTVPEGWVPPEVEDYERRNLEIPPESEGPGTEDDGASVGSGEAGNPEVSDLHSEVSDGPGEQEQGEGVVGVEPQPLRGFSPFDVDMGDAPPSPGRDDNIP